MTTLVNVRIDENDKRAFTELCNSLGLSVTTAFNMFVKQSIRDQRIPVELALHRPNSETLLAIKEANEGIGLSKAYDSVEELMEALDAEDSVTEKI